MGKKKSKSDDGSDYTISTVVNGEKKTITGKQFAKAAKRMKDLGDAAAWKPPELIAVDIRKAKITRDDTLHVEYLENYDDLTHSTISKDCDQLVHPDLTEAFTALVPHLVILCDQKGDETADKYVAGIIATELIEELREKYKVTGFSISGDEGANGVTLIGRKILSGKVLNLLSPFEKLSSSYQWTQDLNDRIEACKKEVHLYLNGKAAIKQQSLDFDSAEADGQKQEALEEQES